MIHTRNAVSSIRRLASSTRRLASSTRRLVSSLQRLVSSTVFAVCAFALLFICAAPQTAHAAPAITPLPSPGAQTASPVPITTRAPRPSPTPWNQLGNRVSPTPSPTTDPMVQKSIRENVENASAIDIVPTPPAATENRALTFAEAADSAVEAARPTFRNMEIARGNAQKQIDGLRDSVNMAIVALDTDDRYLELVAAEELWEDKLEPDLKLELRVYKNMDYEELTSDERRELIGVRDMGYERFNFNLKQIDYNAEVMEQQLRYAAHAQYAGIAKLQAAIGLQADALGLQKVNLDILNAKYELGTAARVEVENATLSYEKAGIELVRQRRSLTSLVTAFNNLIGENLGTTYADFDRAKLLPAGRDTALDTYLARALESRSEILTAAEEMNLSRRQAALYETELTNFKTLDDKQEAIQTAQETEITYELAVQDVERGVREAYKQLVALRGNLAYNESQVDTARENYDRTQKLFELGLATAVSVDQVRLSLTQAQMQLENVRIDIWLQRQKLSVISGIGPGNI